jgi:hypothetical protein
MLLEAIKEGISLLFILFLLFSFSRRLVNEISLLKRASYTVAHPIKVYRSAKSRLLVHRRGKALRTYNGVVWASSPWSALFGLVRGLLPQRKRPFTGLADS